MCIVVRNQNARPADYEHLKNTFRPGHGDFTWWKKFGIRDYRGGGRLSGRETVARVIGGAVAKQILGQLGITVWGHTVMAAGVRAERFDRAEIELNPLRCADSEAAKRMLDAINELRSKGESAGGVVEIVADGVPAGLGEPIANKLDATIGSAMFSIGAVKAVEFGAGIRHANMVGSESNDELSPNGFLSNNAGGVLGGISNGMPIVVRLTVKPTPSVSVNQRTMNMNGQPMNLRTTGRHDACICPRIVPVAEAMLSIVLLDALMQQLQREVLMEHLGLPSPEEIHHIGELRERISQIDTRILHLLSMRFGYAKRIGKLKLEQSLPVLDDTREKTLRKMYDTLAQQYGLSSKFVQDLFTEIIEESKRLQSLLLPDEGQE